MASIAAGIQQTSRLVDAKRAEAEAIAAALATTVAAAVADRRTREVARTLTAMARIPDVVYVGSMGRAWGPSPERGVFRTKDGGKTWKKVLFKSDGAGVIDLIMSPEDPNLLFAAVWEFERKAWGSKTGGPEGGLWKSTDGGNTWKEITRNEGLPAGMQLIGPLGGDDRLIALASAWHEVSDWGRHKPPL